MSAVCTTSRRSGLVRCGFHFLSIYLESGNMKKLKVLILGGNRFFGRHLARELVARGLDVTLLNRGRIDDGLDRTVARLKADRSNSDELSAVLGTKTWDIVFDQICFNGTDAAALAKILEGKTERLIFTSTQSVYDMGLGLREEDFNATTYVPREPRVQSYQEQKREAEAVYAQHPALHVATVRIPIILGLDDYTGRLKWHIEKSLRGQEIDLPNVTARLNFLRSDFAGRLIAELAMTSFSGPINFASPGEISVREILNTVEQSTGRPIKFKERAEASPFGVQSDWTMNLSQMNKLGLSAPPLMSWLPELVQELTEASRRNLDMD